MFLLVGCGGTTTREIVREVVVTATPTAMGGATAMPTASTPAPGEAAAKPTTTPPRTDPPPTNTPEPTTTNPPAVNYQGAPTATPEPPTPVPPSPTSGPRLSMGDALLIAGGVSLPSGLTVSQCSGKWGFPWPGLATAQYQPASRTWTIQAMPATGYTVRVVVDDTAATAALGTITTYPGGPSC